jgi:GNAT superfamily N-acetyltransferase
VDTNLYAGQSENGSSSSIPVPSTSAVSATPPNIDVRPGPSPRRGGEAIRRAAIEDAEPAALLLHAFNTEFSAPTPGAEVLAGRLRALLGTDAATVLLAGEPPCGIAVLRLRPSLWAEGLDAYLEELYVEPGRRGQGIGRALLGATIEAARGAGATRMEIGTSETDAAARRLYESCGFSDREGGPGGPQMLFYERDL